MEFYLKEKFNKLLKTLNNDELYIIDKLSYIIDFIRPKNPKEIKQSLEAIGYINEFFAQKSSLAVKISNDVNILFIDSKISTNITKLDILSREGFRHEISERFYNKFLPTPPKNGDLRYIFATLFNKKNDYIWVNNINTEKWIELFSSIFSNDKYLEKTKNHLYQELLYAAEILSIWIASKEFDENFIRLDKTLLNNDSAFIALQRSISDFIHKIQLENINIETTNLDFQHIHVLIGQCKKLIKSLKNKSINHGISMNLTYELERLTQIIARLETVLDLIKKFDTNESYFVLIELFRQSVRKNETKNSLYEIFLQNIKILAKSITNNTSEHGENYIVNNSKQYIKMFLSASGAGIIIAFMALIKINISQMGVSLQLETILSSLNYGLGFVLIHLLGFTVATKQPAMTASTFAQAVQKEENNKANQKRLIELIMQVSRSQFAAVLGNVTFALIIAFGVSFYMINSDKIILTPNEANNYIDALHPLPALIFAAIAGVWLFCSGLIAGYFDNRADFLELEHRYYYHPLLKKILRKNLRKRVAQYLHEHHGAIAGNFFFGILLGITPFIGYLFDIPLDIRHVAFSTANLGYSSTHIDISILEFVISLIFVFLIGFVNLAISFILALKVSLLSMDTYFGNPFTFLKLLFKEALKSPKKLFLPPKDD